MFYFSQYSTSFPKWKIVSQQFYMVINEKNFEKEVFLWKIPKLIVY